MWILLTVRVFNFLLMERRQVILQEPLELLICSVTQVSSITHLFSSELLDALFSTWYHQTGPANCSGTLHLLSLIFCVCITYLCRLVAP